MLRWISLFLLTLLGALGQQSGMTAFTTGGHTVYHLRPATVVKGGRAIVSAALDGYVLCHSADGRLLWKTQTGGNMPFDLAVADIDSDGLDETFVASGDGSLYAIGHDGRRLWTFSRTAPLFQVAVAKMAGGATVILTGGVEQVLYTLSPQGKVLRQMQTPHCIRHVRTGSVLGNGGDQVAVATASTGLSGILSLWLVDPANLNVLWKQTNIGTKVANSGRRFFSLLLLDMNHDGKQEILLSNGWGENGKLYAFDHTGKQFLAKSDTRIPNVSYRMNLLSHVKLPADEFVLGLFANILIVYNLDGTCREVITAPYDYSNGAFDPSTKTYYLGGSTSGDDGIYALPLDRPGWQKAFQGIKPAGKLARVEANVAQLKKQIAAFRPPPYQPKPSQVIAIARRPGDAKYSHLSFVENLSLSQKFDDCKEVWCRSTDARQPYKLTADEIVAMAREREAAGRDFLIWSGHGHAVYMPLSTMERVLQAAPRHLYGFEFAEMEGVDEDMQAVVERIIIPLAELCARHGGKKIVFRNKNIFYTGAAYVPFWQKVFSNPKLTDVFAPALEETNSRTAELSLAGRVGLWLNGTFNRWASRVVTDNACFDRMWEWSSQQVQNHHLRQLIANAALGATVFFTSVHQGPFSRDLEEQFAPFYEMIEKGIIHIPERQELLSVSPTVLAMKSPPSPLYIRHGINGHAYRYAEDDHSPMVFDRLDAYWGGAPTLPHDFSSYAMNVQRRTTNFLPETPYGLVAIVPEAGELPGRRRISTDGQFFYDGAGARKTAPEYRSTIEKALRESAAELPIVVKGSVNWSVARLDSTHVRVTLVDSGYLDPNDREAEIVIQKLQATECVDILSGEKLRIESGRVRLTVPMGAVRIVDLAR